MRRPTQEQHDQALAGYRAAESPESIAEATGLDLEVVETLIYEGLPAGRKSKEGERPPAIESFESQAQSRGWRIRNAQLDWAQTLAENAAKTAEIRAKNAERAAKIESTIMQVWAANVAEAMRGTTSANPPAVSLLVVSKDVLATLKALRVIQDPTIDARAGDLWRLLHGTDKDDDAGTDDWEKSIRDLVSMTHEEQEEFGRTGKKPDQQLGLGLGLDKAG